MNAAFFGYFAVTLTDHVTFLRDQLSRLLWSPWWQYRLVDDSFWQTKEDMNGTRFYSIRMEWLLMPELRILTTKISDGLVLLTEPQFYNIFLCVLYRFMLIDVRKFIVYLWKNASIYDDVLQAIGGHIVEFEHRFKIDELYARLSRCSDRSVEDLSASARFCLESTDGSSSILNLLLKREERLDATSRKTSRMDDTWNLDTALNASNMPDLEDLFKNDKMAPCMREVIRKTKHLKFQDRLNVSNYLRDMGYSAQKIVGFLCNDRHGDTTESYESDLEAVLKTYEKRGAKYGSTPSAFSSTLKTYTFDCARIINMVSKGDNILRCVYEQEANRAGRRTNHTVKEKQDFMEACFCEATQGKMAPVGRILNPVDYFIVKTRQ